MIVYRKRNGDIMTVLQKLVEYEVTESNMHKSIETLLAENPQVTFDQVVAMQLIIRRKFKIRLAQRDTTLLGFLREFPTSSVRHEFLAFYLTDWKAKHKSVA